MALDETAIMEIENVLVLRAICIIRIKNPIKEFKPLILKIVIDELGSGVNNVYLKDHTWDYGSSWQIAYDDKFIGDSKLRSIVERINMLCGDYKPDE